jgi:hypothetical protein
MLQVLKDTSTDGFRSNDSAEFLSRAYQNKCGTGVISSTPSAVTM